jgi:transaldolase/glucose-6-phosphate isomerase
MNAANEAAMAELRSRLSLTAAAPVSAGFGPRFLHSTGQAHKGGPPTGLFLQISESPAADLPIPGRRLTFGQVVNAQARGDFEVLAERDRRIVRVHFARGAAEGWPALFALLDRAVAGS